MRGKHWCKMCERHVKLSKTGAVPPHRIYQQPLMIIQPRKLTAEQRDRVEEEVRRWVRDQNYISLCSIPVMPEEVSPPLWCNERPFWPRLLGHKPPRR